MTKRNENNKTAVHTTQKTINKIRDTSIECVYKVRLKINISKHRHTKKANKIQSSSSLASKAVICLTMNARKNRISNTNKQQFHRFHHKVQFNSYHQL